VAVKEMNDVKNIKSFEEELRQLSRVSHPNIIQLFGYCKENEPKRFDLLMEYAEGGSLYNGMAYVK
jgi:serine/threonine protein kinase